MGLKERSADRRKRITGHLAKDFDDAEEWDLEFWQRQTPEERLSALVAIHRDIEAIVRGRESARRQRKTPKTGG